MCHIKISYSMEGDFLQKVLIIATYYMPIQSVASNRINAFAKYLHEYGYDVTVLTCSCGEYRGESLENGIKVIRVQADNKGVLVPFDTQKAESRAVHYAKCLYNILLSNLIIDSSAMWTEKATKVALNLMETERFNYVMTSALPIGPHIIGLKLKNMYTHIKWIADMRDAISEPQDRNVFYKYRMRIFEEKILDKCDYLLAVSKPQLELFRSHYKGSELDKFYQIRNGFDYAFSPVRRKNKKATFSIIYAGSFYGARKPKNFFLALLNVLDKGSMNISVRIIGNKAPISIPDKLKKVVTEEEALSYDDICEEMRHADALLMITPSCLEKGIYTGKLFDYLGSGTPIIALAPPNDVAGQLVLKARAGYVAANEDIREIEKVIKKAYQDWEGDVSLDIDESIVLAHHRKAQVNRLVHILKQ